LWAFRLFSVLPSAGRRRPNAPLPCYSRRPCGTLPSLPDSLARPLAHEPLHRSGFMGWWSSSGVPLSLADDGPDIPHARVQNRGARRTYWQNLTSVRGGYFRNHVGANNDLDPPPIRPVMLIWPVLRTMRRSSGAFAQLRSVGPFQLSTTTELISSERPVAAPPERQPPSGRWFEIRSIHVFVMRQSWVRCIR
jgi:hypothetical protein